MLKLNTGENDLYIRRGYTNYTPPKDFFTETNITKELSQTIVPMIIENLKKQLLKKQEENTEIISDAEMVFLCSPVFKIETLEKPIEDLLDKDGVIKPKKELIIEGKKRNIPKLDFCERREVAEQIVHLFVKELEEKELFSFDPGYNTGGHGFCWIRY